MMDASVADALRGVGHDVVRTAELGKARTDDAGILQAAIHAGRILVSLDEHFGDWVVLPLSEHPGVIRIKADPAVSDEILAVLLPFLAEHGERSFKDTLVIVKKTGVRWIRTTQ
jgi:predicted nuclease of predicted toxin-antitoxin system